jgi:hypothetical protein
MANEKPPISTLRRQPVQPWEAAMTPRHGKKRKPRPWLILSKHRGIQWWYKDPKKQTPQWRVYRRYATEKSREQAMQVLSKDKYHTKWYDFRLAKD